MKILGRTLCIFSPKGGMGKTVLTLNLAGAASNLKLRTLVLDFDMYNGCISSILGEEINKTVYHLIDDLLNNRYKKLDDYLYKYNEYINILPAPKDPRQGSKISGKYIELLIDKVRREYDLVLIDTSSIMDEVNVITLDSSDSILFVIDNDYFTLKNTRNIINIFNDIEKFNYKVLLNQSIRENTPFFTMSDIKKIIGANIDYNISKASYIKDITSYLYDGKIPSLISSYKKKADYKTLELIIKDVKEGEINEEE